MADEMSRLKSENAQLRELNRLLRASEASASSYFHDMCGEIASAVQAERERCAKLAEDYGDNANCGTACGESIATIIRGGPQP